MNLLKSSILTTALLAASLSYAQEPITFNHYFSDNTLRLDYIFSGNHDEQHIAVDELCRTAGWAGRHTRLDSLPLQGNGTLVMTDRKSGRVIYRHSFSTLFQEWIGTEEATRTTKAFENVFLAPMPIDSADVEVTLYDMRGRLLTQLKHPVAPKDILLRPIRKAAAPHRMMRQSKRPDAIDVAIVAEGYTAAEMDTFYAHAEEACRALFASKPFARYADAFNVVAVALPSAESGVSIPHKNLWLNTPLSSHFDTFYSERYLTTLRLRDLHNALAGIPYEHIIILANTDNYGGGGIYNSYTLTTARHASFRPVVVHEFGHSFAGLADEYYYDDQYEQMYVPEREPWEQNITTLKDFSKKWADMLPKKTKIPTEPDAKHPDRIGVYEGAGYRSKGAYRAFLDCRMKTNAAPDFCPVCCRAIERLIRFYLDED